VAGGRVAGLLCCRRGRWVVLAGRRSTIVPTLPRFVGFYSLVDLWASFR
jgi:hypothetical protein